MGTHEDDGDLSPPEESASPVAPFNEASPQVPPNIEIPATRASRAWVGVLPALVVLAVLLVFVFQNRKDVRVSFFNLSGTLPLSVALLASAALSALLVLALGSVRIIQLRRRVRRSLTDPDERHD